MRIIFLGMVYAWAVAWLVCAFCVAAFSATALFYAIIEIGTHDGPTLMIGSAFTAVTACGALMIASEAWTYARGFRL